MLAENSNKNTHTHTLSKIKQQTRMMIKGVKHFKLNKHQLINERLKICTVATQN